MKKIDEVITRRKSGETLIKIATDFGVTIQAISYLVKKYSI